MSLFKPSKYSTERVNQTSYELGIKDVSMSLIKKETGAGGGEGGDGWSMASTNQNT